MSELALSASRINTYKSCSYKYYCNYILNLPQESNLGAQRGNVVHEIFELLQIKNDKNLIKQLLEDVQSSEEINNQILESCKTYKISKPEDLELIYKFLYTGLKYDFFSESGEIQPPEEYFKLGDPEKDGYMARGFIDKYAIYHKDKLVKIYDYKSSKQKYSKDELENSIQAMMYSLVMLKKFPEYKSVVEFIFLKFSKNPICRIEFDKSRLDGFEEYLKYIYSILLNFSYEDAKSNYAANGMLWKMHCGVASYPGELKDDGTPKHYCSFKFPFDYYAVVNEKGENVKTSKKLEELECQDGDVVLKKRFAGCPYWMESQEKSSKF